MTAAEQFQRWGACVEPRGDVVILQVGKEMVALTPDDAQGFAFWLAHAYYVAGLRGRYPSRLAAPAPEQAA